MAMTGPWYHFVPPVLFYASGALILDDQTPHSDSQSEVQPLSLVDPVGVSITQLIRVLFRKPVCLRTWFGLGFMLFLTTNLLGIVVVVLFQIPGLILPALKPWYDDGGVDKVMGWYQDNLVFFWTILLISLLVVGSILTVLSWLRSRGIIMFLHGVATGNGNIPQAWAASRVPGNALFLWRILISTLVLLGFLVACVVLWLGVFSNASTTPEGQLPDIPVWSIVLSTVIAILSLVIGAIVNVIFDLVVVPAMYVRACGARAACNAIRNELLPGRFWLFVGFILFQWALQFVSGTALQFIVLASCGLGLVPYIGSVLTLPAIFPLVAYQLGFYQQFGGKWLTLPVEAPPLQRWAGDVPPTMPINPESSG